MSDKGSPEPKFRPARRNANRHSQRGLGMLTRAMQRGGYVAPMTATADGEIIDGSARLEVSEDVFDGVEPLVVDHDGTRPVIMRRTDIPNADDPRAVAIALEANRIAEADLVWDPEVLAEIAAEGEVDLSQLWTAAELDAFHLGVPDEGALLDKYGEWEERDGWPLIRIQVPPETLDHYAALMRQAPGEDEATRLAAILRAVDTSALGG
jgi:hypothetical protein